jgi:hypothetical protein
MESSNLAANGMGVRRDALRFPALRPLKGAAHQAFTAAGVRPPPTVSPLEMQPEPDSLSSGA